MRRILEALRHAEERLDSGCGRGRARGLPPWRGSTLARVACSVFLTVGLLACGEGGGGEQAEDAEADMQSADMESAADEAPSNPRFGIWRMDMDAEPPAENLMYYEPWGDGGMKITVHNTNAEGNVTEWSYTTLFDGVFREVEGQEGATTAVEVVDERTNRILNARGGEVYQTIMNVLSEDGNTIDNEYIRTLPDGTERISHAVYRRVE